MGWSKGVEPLTSRATIWRSANWTKTTIVFFGAPRRIRTFDLCLRRALLYPAELWKPIWSRWRESDPRNQLGRLVFYHWTTPAHIDYSSITYQGYKVKNFNKIHKRILFFILPCHKCNFSDIFIVIDIAHSFIDFLLIINFTTIL